MAWSYEKRKSERTKMFLKVFGQSADKVAETSETFQEITKKLRGAQKTSAKLWWNIHSLEHYLQQDIYPRGLRVQIFPGWKVSRGFKKTWESGLNKCSAIMIGMLLKHDKELLRQKKAEIGRLEAQLNKFYPAKMVKPFLHSLQDDIDDLEDDLEARKQSILDRDLADFETGRAYRWRRSRKSRSFSRSRSMSGYLSSASREMSSEISDFFISSGSEFDGGSMSDVSRRWGYRRNPWR